MRAHAIAAQPAGRRQFEHPREAAVVGQQQQPFGVDVEPADRDDARQIRGQGVEDGRPAFRVVRRGDEPARLVEQEQPRALGARSGSPSTLHVVGVADVEGRACQHHAVDADAARGDPRSASRREHRPARAITLAMRWPRASRPVVLNRLRRHVRSALQPRTPVARAVRSPCAQGQEADGAEAEDPMSAAFAEARAAERRGEAPIGAAIARAGVVVARAGNRTLRARRSDRACGNAGDPRGGAGARQSPAHRLRSLRHAGAVRDVRRRDQPRAAAPALFRRRGPQGRRGRARAAIFPQPTCLHAPEVYGGSGKAKRRNC